MIIIKNYYQKEGFLDIEVDSDLTENYEKETVEVEFIVQENRPVQIEQVNYNLKLTEPAENNKLQPLLKHLTNEFSLKKGARFRDEELLLAQNKLSNWLVKQGYAYAKSYPPDTTLQDEFERAEEYARENRLGMWGECGG